MDEFCIFNIFEPFIGNENGDGGGSGPPVATFNMLFESGDTMAYEDADTMQYEENT